MPNIDPLPVDMEHVGKLPCLRHKNELVVGQNPGTLGTLK
jgi:hypothetical protein